MSRHCWVIEVPTARGGWKFHNAYTFRWRAKRWLNVVNAMAGADARIVKYTPEGEDEGKN